MDCLFLGVLFSPFFSCLRKEFTPQRSERRRGHAQAVGSQRRLPLPLPKKVSKHEQHNALCIAASRVGENMSRPCASCSRWDW